MPSFLATGLHVVLAVALAVCCIGFTGCSNTTNRDLAEAGVNDFHHQLDLAQYEKILREGAEELRGNEADTKSYLKEVHDVLGLVKDTKQAAGSVQNMPEEAQITLTYLTTFQNGGGSETFVWRVKDRKAKLVFYDVKASGVRSRD